MIELKTEYNGYTVEWIDFRRCLKISKDGTNVKNVKNLEEAEKWINQQNRKKWKRINVLYIDGRHNFFSGEATSIIDDESAWVVRSNGSRRKINIGRIFTDTPENKRKIDDISELLTQIQARNNSIKDIYDTLETITPEMMDI